MIHCQSTRKLLANLVLCCSRRLRADELKWVFSFVLLHFSSNPIFDIQSDVAILYVTTRIDKVECSLLLVKESSFLRNMLQSFLTKLQKFSIR